MFASNNNQSEPNKSSQETFSSIMTNNISTGSTIINQDKSDNSNMNITTNPTSEQSIIHTLPSNDVENWKCRECGFINRHSDHICDTCETPKPIHPLLEKHLSCTRRSPSPSPSNTRSSSPEEEEEIMDNRASSQSSVRSSRKSYSSQSSSSSSSSDDNDNEYESTKNIKTQSQSFDSSSKEKSPSRESIFSSRTDRNLQDDDFKSDNNRMPSNSYSNNHRSHSRSPSPNYYSCIAPLQDQPVQHPYDSGRSKLLTNQTNTDVSSIMEQNNRHQMKILNQSVISKEDNRNNSPLPSHSIHNHYQSLRTTTTERQPYQNSSSSNATIENNSIIVYVPDLPVNIHNNQTLEDMISECLKRRHRIQILKVKCYTQLGIGIIYLDNEKDRDDLINEIRTTILESSSKTMISFTNQLELISYVIIDTQEMTTLPSTNDICQQWIQSYKTHSEVKCEPLSIHFPNIFRIITYSLDELINSTLLNNTIQINQKFASVYFRADCCFYENLPRTTTLERLKQAISQQITNEYMSKELIHIQYNKDSINAVVITSGKARIWSLHNSILLDKKTFMKKDKLACRLIIRSVPSNISHDMIKNHQIFENSAIKSFPSSEHVILELHNKNVFEHCIKQGALRVGNHSLSIDVYTPLSNPEDHYIDDETWYSTEMCDYKPDITPFLSNLQHDIFRLKWNSQAFLKQFHLWKSNNHYHTDKDQNQCNLQRHLLRMTVMLNTIGVIKKGFYRIDNKEIKLKPERLKTILYDHKSKLAHGQTISLSNATKFPYSSTKVKVVNNDCLIVYKNLVKEGYRPVILNMANATNPGGGYKRGDGAQEETLFRRSNYYQSLDLTLDDNNNNEKSTERFYCNSNSIVEILDKNKQLYPMDKYGAIYTSGLTVFREPEETGYTFMNIPMYDVCAIAMAAYREPKLINKHLLKPKYSIGTRKKIENIFAIAHHHKHDCLVLSAFGCGAFRNPPEHIAKIFKSVIEQYAGYFKCIYFAIIDDHNAGHDLNPLGNYQPFQKLLDNLDIKPKQDKLVDMMIGPWRILDQISSKEIILSDIRICYLKPCHYGGNCEDLIKNEQHCKEYSHPPLCPNEDNMKSCKEKHDDQHILWFRHRQKCRYGGECELIEKDFKHLNEYEHPEFCRDGGQCENMDHQHLKSYRHVPICKYHPQCTEYNSKSRDHCEKFRHCKSICHFGYFCVRFHDEKHLNEFKHPFKNPCPLTPFHCLDFIQLSEANNIKTVPKDVQNHCLQYSHVCRFGRQCKETSDIHWETTIHVARQVCPHVDQCTKIHQEDHLNSYSHPNISDIRRLCKYPGYQCRDKRKPEHIKQFRHEGNHDCSGVISCFGLNRKVNFFKNQENIIQAIKTYGKHLKNKPSISKEAREFVKALQPIHRCGKIIFESILLHGHVMSSKHMEHLKKPDFVAQAVQEHKHVRAILDRHKIQAIEEHAKEYIRALVSLQYNKKYNGLSSDGNNFHPLLRSQVQKPSHEYDQTLNLKERILNHTLKPNEINTIKAYAINIAEASWNLHNSPTGIKYQQDKSLGTDKHIFSILGPHRGHYYGDIFIVFKSQVMLHPDANFSPQAATSFVNRSTFEHRPWVRDPGSQSERITCFHESKLHCSIPEYDYAAAAELMAVTGLHEKTMDVSVKDILKRWKNIDSHQVFEAHLPQLIPLHYVDEIYIPRNLFASLTSAAQTSARKIFGESLHITKHDVDLNGMPFGSDKNRLYYQDYVIDELIKKIQKRMERSIQRLYGTVVTLTPRGSPDHILLPLRIHDAYNQYRQINKHRRNSNNIYIYWQAMYGDMMITLSDEPINPQHHQSHIRCLVCYIAATPSKAMGYHNESYSYINAQGPYAHDSLTIDGRQPGVSRSFHRDCNVEDFVTYCLKLEKETGQVTLSHAGSNSIYCYETISYKFSKSTLDLNKLNYVHVSARSQKVPIRNLIINFEQIIDLHPTFDKNFKRGDNSFPRNKKSDKNDRKSSPETKKSSEEKSPSIFRKVVNAVADFVGYGDDDVDDNDKKHKSNGASSTSSSGKSPSNYHREKGSDDAGRNTQQIACRHGSEYRDQNNNQHCSTYSHPRREHGSKSTASSNSNRIPCRYGRDCRDQGDSHHCSKYSHSSSSSSGSNSDRTACRHGHNCRDKNDSQHCSKYSHPSREHQSESSASSNSHRTACRYGHNCRDKNDIRHCLKYSHPDNQRHRDDRTRCKFGDKCHDFNPSHRSEYSHPPK